MSQASPVACAVVDSDPSVAARANVSLKGTSRGLEILIASAPSSSALGERLIDLLAEAPGFFAGSDARVAFEGALPAGALACLEEVAGLFDLKIVEIGPVVAKRARTFAPLVRRKDDAPRAKLAEGSGPIAEAASATPVASTTSATEGAHAAEPAADAAPGDGAPVEVALANTAPYSLAAIVADAKAATVEAAAVGTADACEAPPSEAAPASVTPDQDAVPVEAAPASVTPDQDAVPAAVEAAPASAAPDWVLAPEAAAPAALLVEPAPPAVDPAALAAAIEAAVEARAAELLAAMPPGPKQPKLVIGPVRSGVIVDHTGHVIILGDVNPGAEVRAEGSIIVLGRLRGVAHAAIGREAGFIIALSLAPQQLRICRMVARAAESDRPSDGAEIAYVTGETIVVERFTGRLPSGLAASM